MAEFLRPDSNVTQADFTGGFAEIDEATPSDADRAYGANNTAAVLEVGLSNPSGTPGSGTSTFRYRYAKVNNGTLDGGGNAVTITAEVVQGSTVLATDAAQTCTGTVQTRSWTPDLSGVTDWTDLRLRFTTSSSGGSPANRRGGAVYWAELEAPAASITVTPSNTTHSHSAAQPTISAKSSITAANNIHAHSATSPTVSVPGTNISPADSTLSHTATSPTVAAHASIVVGSCSHSHVTTSPTVGTNNSIVPQNALHVHVATSPSLSSAASLTVDDAGHLVDSSSPLVSYSDNIPTIEVQNNFHLFSSSVPDVWSPITSVSLRRKPSRGTSINSYKAQKYISNGRAVHRP